MKKLSLLRLLLAVAAVIIFFDGSAYAKKPEITSHDAQYLNQSLKINVQWRSTEPIVSIKVAAGKEVKVIKVDPHNNKRNPSGYSGEEDVVLQTDPTLFQASIPYSIQLEDEDGQKSELLAAKVAISASAFGRGAEDDQWGKEGLAGPSGQQRPDMIDKLRQVAQVLAAPPVLIEVTVNNPGSLSVTFKTKATHTIGLKEINFRVFDSSNKQVDNQQILTTGKFWEGTSKEFTLPAGNYFVIAQAVDSSGSTSPERRAHFTIGGTKADKDKAEQDRIAKEKSDKDKAEQDRIAKEKADKDKAEQDRIAKEKSDKEKAEQDRLAKEKADKDKAEQDRLAKEKAEKDKAEQDRIAKEEADKDKAEQDRIAKEKADKDKAEQDRIAKEKADKEKGK